MSATHTLQLSPKVTVQDVGGDILLAGPFGALRIMQAGASVRTLLSSLGRGGMHRDALCDEAADGGTGDWDRARLYFAVAEFERKGFIHYSAADGDRPLATLEPVAAAFRFEPGISGGQLRLSRFACLRRVDSRLIVESPLGQARVVLHDSPVAGMVALLAAPHTLRQLASAMPAVGENAVQAVAVLLVNAGTACAYPEDGRMPEDESVPLRQWEFHDLLFHSRSRLGRYDAPYGATFRFDGLLQPLAAVKPPLPGRRVPLYKPDMQSLEERDVPFSRVSEERRSLRRPGEEPLSAAQLGEFLYRAARVKEVCETNRERGILYDVSTRPVASGGASYELELYLTVVRCTDLVPGVYHYDPLGHELEHVADFNGRVQDLVDDACVSAAIDTPPDVLITVSARFQRVTWKYESIAYAIMLKNTGALYQQMYLVATAMNLAPCALGGGNSDLFADVAGLEYFTETSVGEFMLSRR